MYELQRGDVRAWKSEVGALKREEGARIFGLHHQLRHHEEVQRFKRASFLRAERFIALQQQGYPKFCTEQHYAEATTAVLYYADESVFSHAHSLLLDSLKGPANDSQLWALSEFPNGTDF